MPQFLMFFMCPNLKSIGEMCLLPLCDDNGRLAVEPYKILDKKMVKRRNVAVVYALVQWANGSIEDATWELLEDLLTRFPNFDVSS